MRHPAPPAYPLQLTGRLDADLSRGLWLVKWLLAIPHYIVLVFLWIAFAVVTFIAFFAILFTGRYPRGLFDFNVGVLRWSWRVGYYSYSALGTDRYPPFSLRPPTTRPTSRAVPGAALPRAGARQVVAVGASPSTCSSRSSRVAGGSAGRSRPTPSGSATSPGLIGLLVLFAAVALLFTGRYPLTIFDFVMGLNRWVYRVVAYATLMTDEYPPFRLDQGGDDITTVREDGGPVPPPAPLT